MSGKTSTHRRGQCCCTGLVLQEGDPEDSSTAREREGGRERERGERERERERESVCTHARTCVRACVPACT